MTSRSLNQLAFVVLTIVLIAAACGRKTRTAQPVGPSLPADELLFRQGFAAFHEGTPEGYTRAGEAFRKATALRPQQCEYSLSLAQSLLFLADEQRLNFEEFEPRRAEAGTLVNSAAAACSASHEPVLLRLRSIIAGRSPATAEMINRAVDLDPNDAVSWIVLGKLDPASSRLVNSQGSGKWVSAVRAAELVPESALIQYELGNNLSSLRPEVRDAFERALQLNPRHFRSYLGLVYTAGETVDVEPLYRKVIEIAPDFLEGRIAFGSFYAGLDEIEKAREQYSAAASANPKYDVAPFRLGLLMLQAEKPDEAEKYFRTVVDLNPLSFEAYYYLGNISLTRNALDQAKTDYDHAVQIRSNYAEAEYGLGQVYRRQARLDLALTQFETAIRISPGYADAYLSRGDIRVERRQFRDGLADYQKAIELLQQRVQSLETAIRYGEAHPESRLIQAELRRNQREKGRLEALLGIARQYRSGLEDVVRANP